MNLLRRPFQLPRFGSASLAEHLLRGAVGCAAFASASIAARHTPFGWLLVVIALVAWRGCPTCWLVGFYQTVNNRLADRKLDKVCEAGQCRVVNRPLSAGMR